jgi:hypothetical protein
VFVTGRARSRYVPLDGEVHAVRAEVGITLPSGDFRLLATSRAITPPRLAPAEPPAAEAAVPITELPARMSWEQARNVSMDQALEALAEPVSKPASAPTRSPIGPRPGGASDTLHGRAPGRGPGGASDNLHGGASDRYRR